MWATAHGLVMLSLALDAYVNDLGFTVKFRSNSLALEDSGDPHSPAPHGLYLYLDQAAGKVLVLLAPRCGGVKVLRF